MSTLAVHGTQLKLDSFGICLILHLNASISLRTREVELRFIKNDIITKLCIIYLTIANIYEYEYEYIMTYSKYLCLLFFQSSTLTLRTGQCSSFIKSIYFYIFKQINLTPFYIIINVNITSLKVLF